MQEQINELLREGESYNFYNNSQTTSLGTFSNPSSDFLAWIARVEHFILEYYGEDSAPFRLYQKFERRLVIGNYADKFNQQHIILIAALKSCIKITPKIKPQDVSKELLLNIIFNKFHNVVHQLRNRYQARPKLEVDDEYDVQDLLHALLRLHFDDIRKEEWTPSYAGGASRMDFLLKEEQIVIEAKRTRKGLADAELGKQLIVDKEKYKAHPDCKRLICFTYDPESKIVNPQGIINDLNKNEPDFRVDIIIRPRNL